MTSKVVAPLSSSQEEHIDIARNFLARVEQ